MKVCQILICVLLSHYANAFQAPRLQTSIQPQTHTRTKHTTSLSMVKGTAATPIKKKTIAVFGAGGYLGGLTFGFLQRASSLFGTGISGTNSPRAIAATSVTADSVNRLLGKHFALAQASENFFTLRDFTKVKSVARTLQSVDGVIMGTKYQLEKRPVTMGTYEDSPNSKTMEFFLDERYGTMNPVEDEEMDAVLFKNTVKACMKGDVKHMVVIETPSTTIEERVTCAEILERSGITYTYLIMDGELVKCGDLNYNFEKGVQNTMRVKAVKGTRTQQNPAGWVTELGELSTDEKTVLREDVAALAVQCLLSLDWKSSRVLLIQSGAKINDVPEKGFGMVL
mmetsp:Transcript_30019/g.34531  ORF Transcript_30019/g.34531 Transcript_30019/m.34531 type:complete len:340 (-) Transcript_30019:44-1063(-)